MECTADKDTKLVHVELGTEPPVEIRVCDEVLPLLVYWYQLCVLSKA